MCISNPAQPPAPEFKRIYMSHLEIAEKYVEWAAAKNMTAENVWRAIWAWPALHLTRKQRQYIKVYAERKCPAVGWTRPIRIKQK